MERATCADAPLLSGEAYLDALGQAYPSPYGFILGLQAAGLFLYNGNRLLGARIAHFESQLGYTPVLTDAVDLDVWHHVVFTHAADGTARIYLARQDTDDAWAYSGNQPLCAMRPGKEISTRSESTGSTPGSRWATGKVRGKSAPSTSAPSTPKERQPCPGAVPASRAAPHQPYAPFRPMRHPRGNGLPKGNLWAAGGIAPPPYSYCRA